MNLGDQLARFLALTDQVVAATTALDDLRREREAAELQLRDAFAKAGVQNLKARDGRVVYLARTLWARSKDGDKLAVTKALRSEGIADLVTETFNTSQLSAYVRELERNGEPLPEALASVIEVAETFQLRVLAGR